MSAVGFGIRSKRFAMIIDDLVVSYLPSLLRTFEFGADVIRQVTYIGVENSPGVVLSSADAILKEL